MHIRILTLLLLTFLSFSISAQQMWSSLSTSDLNRLDIENQQIIPQNYKVFSTDFENMRTYLRTNQETSFTLDIPLPDGTIEQFQCKKAGLIPDDLQEKYPSILSFDGKGINTRSSSMKFGISTKGFHAMILTPGRSPVFIDVIAKGNTSYYMSYYKADYQPKEILNCEFSGESDNQQTDNIEALSIAGDCQLRSYRLALACTGEYATFHGGTKESTLAEFAVAMARVNGIYEKDLGITMVLIPNTDDVIYLNGGTDPYTNNSGGTMLGENQATLDDVIGTVNYDIGHVFSTGGGGIAQLNSPCGNNSKARGVTGLNSPINDPFYVDYVCHEMGHQFGANHTQNNECNRNDNTAMEVGSANTIMGYAGICNPNSKNASDDHFHAISILEISNFIVNGNGNSCDELVTIENTPPTVTLAKEMYNVPKDTPFMLTAIADDADGDILTYCWEQMDNEVANMPPELTNTGGPAFISNSPLLSETRVFPNMNAVVNNSFPQWEVLPNVAREMNFRVTVRDNKNLLGCTTEADVLLDVDGAAGPFLVQAPNTNVSWKATEEETVEWDVANTDGGNINCVLVDILLSTDGGFEYPVVLAEQVPNDGSHVITVPAEVTTTARVMVKCSDNVFFDISNTNFSIESPFTFSFDQEELTVCEGDQASISISTEGFDGFAEAIEFTVENSPSGIDYNFTTNPVNTPESTTINFTNISPEPGIYTIDIIGSAPGISISKKVTLFVEPSQIDDLVLQFPENGATQVELNTTLSWDPTPGVTSYEVTLSQSPALTDPIIINVNDIYSVNISALENNTVYYWRVKANTNCAANTDSELFAFQTQKLAICDIQSAESLPLAIPNNEVGEYSTTMEVNGISSFNYFSCFINLEHSYLGDVIFTLISPQGTELILMDRIGVPGSQFGCASDDLTVTFSDFSTNSSDLLEESCNTFSPDYQPVTPFSSISTENVNGEWTLIVSDLFEQDGGQVIEWDLEFCSFPVLGDPELVNEILIVPFDNSRAVSANELEVETSEPINSTFTLLSLPEHGELFNSQSGTNEILVIGSTFSQQEINDGFIEYLHNGDDSSTDAFLFDAIDDLNQWTYNETFNIIIAVEGTAVVVPTVNGEILCNAEETSSIELSVIGGNAPFTYSIDGGENFGTDSIFNDLGAGEYNVVVLNTFGIEVYDEAVIIDQPDELEIEATSTFYDIFAAGSGGTASYTYSINGMDFFENESFFNVPPGTYIVTVRDENGCESEVEVTHIYDNLELIAITQGIICFGDLTGSINPTSTGGFAPYTYSLDGIDFIETENFEGLAAGNYTLYVKDAGGKIISLETTIIQSEEITFTLDGSQGSFSVQNVTGGNAPYMYSLNNIDYVDSPIFEPLPDGNFIIYVRDASGCIQSLDYQEIGADIDPAQTLCVGDESASFTAIGFGGFPPLRYSIDGINFQDNGVFNDLPSGSYMVIILDDFGFQNTVNFEVTSPDPISVTTEYIGGDLIITAAGGTGSYMYSIDGGNTFQASNTFAITEDGDYPIVVTDSNDCIDESMLSLSLVNSKEDQLDELIEIYPVPASNMLYIELDQSIIGKAHMKIYNLVGQEMNFTSAQENNTFSLDISNWSAGQYVLVIESDEAVVTRKVLKF